MTVKKGVKDTAEKLPEAVVDDSGSVGALPEGWVQYITPFADMLGKSVKTVTESLEGLIGEPGEEAISLLKDVKYTPDEDIISKVGESVPTAKLKKAIASLREVSVVPTVESPVTSMGPALFDVLPDVPSDEAWLSSLKVGGYLKFSPETVTGTVSAALAASVGLYELTGKILETMEALARSLEEPVGQDFYKIQEDLTRRSYAEIFQAIPGVDGRFATQKRKDDLLRRINDRLWKSLISYQGQLKGWIDSWQQGMSNPAAMMGVFAAMAGGVGAIPPGMMQPPPTDILHDAADSVVNDINYVFAGTGIPVAVALAYDAQQIRKVLENPQLPAQVGAANREQMLRMLGVAVSSDYPRLEKNLKQYALGIIKFQDVTSGQTELQYIMALYQLGVTIPWDKMASDSGMKDGSSTLTGIGRDGGRRL